MDFSRMMGQKIICLASEKYGSLEEFAKAAQFTARDIGRIEDGRLMLPPDELKEIAKALDVDVTQLMSVDTEACNYMECMTSFNNSENKSLLLNIIDAYVDLEEQIKDC